MEIRTSAPGPEVGECQNGNGTVVLWLLTARWYPVLMQPGGCYWCCIPPLSTSTLLLWCPELADKIVPNYPLTSPGLNGLVLPRYQVT